MMCFQQAENCFRLNHRVFANDEITLFCHNFNSQFWTAMSKVKWINLCHADTHLLQTLCAQFDGNFWEQFLNLPLKV